MTRQGVGYRHLNGCFSVIRIEKGHVKILTLYVLSKNSNDTSHRLFNSISRHGLLNCKEDISQWYQKMTLARGIHNGLQNGVDCEKQSRRKCQYKNP